MDKTLNYKCITIFYKKASSYWKWFEQNCTPQVSKSIFYCLFLCIPVAHNTPDIEGSHQMQCKILVLAVEVGPRCPYIFYDWCYRYTLIFRTHEQFNAEIILPIKELFTACKRSSMIVPLFLDFDTSLHFLMSSIFIFGSIFHYYTMRVFDVINLKQLFEEVEV